MIAITLDIDWAPDIVIDRVANMLIERNVKATWFVTHASRAIDRLRKRPDLFELGIHPNFLPGSTHGDSPAKVLNHCLGIVPEAVSMRAHALSQSTPILAKVIETSKIKVDVSIFLPLMPGIRPFEYNWNGGKLIRVPFFWEDDFEIQKAEPQLALQSLLGIGNGLKVFNFHPVHVFLNSVSICYYNELRRRGLESISLTDVGMGLSDSLKGVGDLFQECIYHAATNDGVTISEVVQVYEIH